jgi:uncharacterized protein YggU (UPF0235/DUF167 family)
MTTFAGLPPSTDPLAPWRADPGALVPVRVTPRARVELVELASSADGSPLLRVHVRAVPERGKANDAVVAAVARAAGLPRSSLRVVHGHASRDKLLRWDR